jgi:succinate dehydrogenase flavin-adding protein (antitoxin of CptAB toxin-antitoxin module)
MRELDAVLEAFLERSGRDLDERDLARFEAILDLPDPALYAYLTGRDDPSDLETAELVSRIRRSVGPSP